MISPKDVKKLKADLRAFAELTGHAAQLHGKHRNISQGIKVAKKYKKDLRRRINQIKKIFDLSAKYEIMRMDEADRKKLIKEFRSKLDMETELIKLIEAYK